MLRTDGDQPQNFARLEANTRNMLNAVVGAELTDWNDDGADNAVSSGGSGGLAYGHQSTADGTAGGSNAAGWDELDDENTTHLIREKRREQRAQRQLLQQQQKLQQQQQQQHQQRGLMASRVGQ